MEDVTDDKFTNEHDPHTYQLFRSGNVLVTTFTTPYPVDAWQLAGGLLGYVGRDATLGGQCVRILRCSDGSCLYEERPRHSPRSLLVSRLMTSLVGVCLADSFGAVRHASLTANGELSWCAFNLAQRSTQVSRVLQRLQSGLVVCVQHNDMLWRHHIADGSRIRLAFPQMAAQAGWRKNPPFLIQTSDSEFTPDFTPDFTGLVGVPHPHFQHWHAVVAGGRVKLQLGGGRVLERRVQCSRALSFDTCTWLADGSGLLVHKFEFDISRAMLVTWT